MSVDYGSVADDFFVNLNLQTTLALPTSRETVLHFYEAVQKEFPSMACFYQREGGEFILEGDREGGTYQWLELQANRMSAGHFNPASPAEAYRFHSWLLDRSVYFLGVSPLDVEALDVMFGFNLDYQGNRDAIVAQALLANSPLAALMTEGSARAVEFEPSLVVSIDEECSLQARLSLETRSSSYQVRTGQYDEEPISVYFAIRRYPIPGSVINIKESFVRQSRLCEDLTARIVVPQVIRPILAAIAAGE
jgi:hypothetical protein